MSREGGVLFFRQPIANFFFVVVVVCCSDLSGEESEVGPSQVKILDPTSSPIK